MSAGGDGPAAANIPIPNRGHCHPGNACGSLGRIAGTKAK